MYTLKLSTKVMSGRENVFKAIKDMERFPEFMTFVKNVKIISNYPNKLISLWQLEIDGAPITWRQEDIIDDLNFEIKFRMLEGDYEHYEGKLSVESIDADTSRVNISAQFGWGMPILEEYVKNVLMKKARLALGGMLKALKLRIEKEYV
jgi:ribosome-associated toxin RatA of RatAB toxin-antitoxin module